MTKDRWELVATEAEAIESDEEETTYVGFSAETNHGKSYCTLSRVSDAGKVYVEIDDQKWGCYDGIQRISLNRNEMVIELNDNGISSLGGVRILRIVLGPQARQAYDRIEKVLRMLLAHRLVVES